MTIWVLLPEPPPDEANLSGNAARRQGTEGTAADVTADSESEFQFLAAAQNLGDQRRLTVVLSGYKIDGRRIVLLSSFDLSKGVPVKGQRYGKDCPTCI